MKTVIEILLLLCLLLFPAMGVCQEEQASSSNLSDKVLINGSVYDEDGNAVSGVDIYAYHKGVGDGWPSLLGQVKSDETGCFAFEVVLSSDTGGAGSVSLYAMKSGWAWERQYWIDSVAMANVATFSSDITFDQGVRFTLRRPGTVSGRVLDTDGAPIVGAVVCPSYMMKNMPYTYLSDNQGVDILEARTDNDGCFLFNNLPIGAYCGFQVTADQYATLLTSRFCTENSDPLERIAVPESGIELQLVPECQLCGNVKDAVGRPLGDVLVWAKQKHQTDANWWSRTTADGTFSFSGLPSGEYIIRAAHNDLSREAFLYNSVVLSLDQGEEIRDVQLNRSEGILVRGKVIENINGQAIPGARIVILGDGERFLFVKADDEGQILFKACLGRYSWRHNSKDYRPVFNEPLIVNGPGDEMEYDFKLEILPKITFHVFNTEGQVVPNAIIKSRGYRCGITNKDGRATVRFKTEGDFLSSAPYLEDTLWIESSDGNWVGSFKLPPDINIHDPEGVYSEYRVVLGKGDVK